MQDLAKQWQESESLRFQEQPRTPRRQRATPSSAPRLQPAPLSFEPDPQQPAMLMHDIRNLLAAFELFSDLLDEPGVLNPRFRHYAGELRQVASASSRLLNRMGSVITARAGSYGDSFRSATPFHSIPGALTLLPRSIRPRLLAPAAPVESLAQELASNRNLLTAIAGPGITLGMSISDGRQPVAMTGDDCTRILVNLVKNAAEAMPYWGHIQITLEQAGRWLRLTVEDSGPGIPESALPHIFIAGYTTRVPLDSEEPESQAHSESLGSPDCDPLADLWPTPRRGLGLAIVHSLVAAAGGRVWAANRPQPIDPRGPIAFSPNALNRNPHNSPEPTGARFHIELPIAANSVAVT